MLFFKKPIFWIWAFIALHSILFLFLDLIPFWDLPNHLAEATIYRYYNVEGNLFSEYYSLVPWYYPNLFYVWFCNLPFFPTVEWGNTFFFILYFTLFLTSLYALIKKLNGNTWFALLGIVFLYGFNTTFGFVGYTISIPVLFWLLYYIISDIETPGLLNKAVQALLLLAIYTMHAQNAMLGLLVLAGLYLYHHRKNLLQLWPHVLTGLPVFIVIAIWWVAKSATINSFAQTADSPENLGQIFLQKNLSQYYERFGILVLDNFQLYAGIAGLIVAFILSTLAFAPALANFKAVAKQGFRWLFTDSRVYLTLFFLINLACYLLLPNHLPGQTPIAHRFGTIVLLSLLAIFSLYQFKYKASKGLFYAVAVALIYSVLWGHYLINFNQLNRGFKPELLSKASSTDRLSGILFNNNYRGRHLYTHYQNYHITWNKGIASTMAIDYRFGIVRRKVPYTKLPKHYEWDKKSDKIDQLTADTDYTVVEYILLKGNNPKVEPVTNSYTPVSNYNDWVLLQKK